MECQASCWCKHSTLDLTRDQGRRAIQISGALSTAHWISPNINLTVPDIKTKHRKNSKSKFTHQTSIAECIEFYRLVCSRTALPTGGQQCQTGFRFISLHTNRVLSSGSVSCFVAGDTVCGTEHWAHRYSWSLRKKRFSSRLAHVVMGANPGLEDGARKSTRISTNFVNFCCIIIFVKFPKNIQSVEFFIKKKFCCLFQ